MCDLRALLSRRSLGDCVKGPAGLQHISLLITVILQTAVAWSQNTFHSAVMLKKTDTVTTTRVPTHLDGVLIVLTV